jgi:hypothetical protein
MQGKLRFGFSKLLPLVLALVVTGLPRMLTAQTISIDVVTFRGAWNATAHYHAGDVVGYQGQSFIASTRNHNQTPSTSSTAWYLLAAQGPQGGLPVRKGCRAHRVCPGRKASPGLEVFKVQWLQWVQPVPRGSRVIPARQEAAWARPARHRMA